MLHRAILSSCQSYSLPLVGLVLGLAFAPFSALGADSGSNPATKVESEVMWYTTMALDDSSVLVSKFKEKFPAVNVKLFRANNSKLLERLLTESRAKTNIADVISAGGLPIGVLKDRGLLAKYLSPEAAAFPAGAKDPDGYWTDIYVNTFNLVYNTTMVSANELPKTYAALLDPKWKDKMGIDDSDYEWFGNILQFMGEEKGLDYMRKLAAQKPTMRAGHSLLATLVAAGEFALYSDGYPRRVEVLRERGARTVDWVWLEPAIAELHPTGIMASAPHPTAARVFTDYLLSAEGQELIGMQFGRVPSRKGIKLKYPRMSIEGRNIHWSNPALTAKNAARYAEMFQSIFGKSTQ
ncbi:MAG: extracellular solute-binding protein [Candidatus Binatia bacterium]